MQETFLIRVKSVRDRGYEIAHGERFVGGLDVGVLVGSPQSTIKAALIVATLQSAHGPDPEVIREAVIRAGLTITQLVGVG